MIIDMKLANLALMRKDMEAHAIDIGLPFVLTKDAIGTNPFRFIEVRRVDGKPIAHNDNVA